MLAGGAMWHLCCLCTREYWPKICAWVKTTHKEGAWTTNHHTARIYLRCFENSCALQSKGLNNSLKIIMLRSGHKRL